IVVAGRPVLHQVAPHQSGTRRRPAPPGSSISHFRVQSSGTFGCVVKDSAGTQYLLSCAHVLSDGAASPADAIVQPGTSHGGAARGDKMATFSQALALAGGADAAIAEIGNVNHVTAVVQHLARPVGTRALTGTGALVQKSGDTTGLTLGVVVGIKGTIGPYAVNGANNIYFSDTIVTSGMSEGGDSGSILMDYQNRAVGLIFGGQQYSNSCAQTSCVASWCTPIDTVLSQLKVTLL